MPVQARRDKSPHLVQHPRQRGRQRGQHGDLDRHQKRRNHAHGNHLGAFGQRAHQRHGQVVVHLRRAGEKTQNRKNRPNAVHRLEQAVAQLKQVLNERLLGTGQFVR